MIRTAVLVGLLAAGPSAGPSAATVEFFPTFSASAVSGDPGATMIAAVVRQATGCDLSGELGEPEPNVRLTAGGTVVYDAADPPADDDPDAGVVLRAGLSELLAVVPFSGKPVRLEFACRDGGGAWTEVISAVSDHGDFDDLPVVMPDLAVEPGDHLRVFDVRSIYQNSAPVVYTARIDAGPATVSPAEDPGALQVKSPGTLTPGLHQVTVQTGKKTLTAPFVQKGPLGTPSAEAAVVTGTPEALPESGSGTATGTGTWRWAVAGAVLIVLLTLLVVIGRSARRRRSRG